MELRKFRQMNLLFASHSTGQAQFHCHFVVISVEKKKNAKTILTNRFNLYFRFLFDFDFVYLHVEPFAFLRQQTNSCVLSHRSLDSKRVLFYHIIQAHRGRLSATETEQKKNRKFQNEKKWNILNTILNRLRMRL